jgi:predicted permease
MNFLRDLRFAVRTLLKNPGFFALAVFTLGLGISANTAIFSLFYQVLLRSLPVPEPGRLVVMHAEGFGLPGSRSADNSETVFSYPLYRGLRDGLHSFQGIAARAGAPVQLEWNGEAERLGAETVTGNFFQVLGVRPGIGRLLVPSDDIVGRANPVAVLSFDYWTKRFGAQSSVLNRTVTLNGNLFTIVGVTPEGFRGVMSGDSPDLFLPIAMSSALMPGWNNFNKPDFQYLTILGRLEPGISRERAGVEMQPLFASIVKQEISQLKITKPRARREIESKRIEALPAAQGLNELEHEWRKPLVVLAAMVGLLMLIACANLANLLLARGVNRSRDTALRLALGAGRGRIVSLLLAESAILAAAGAMAGLALTPWLTNGVLRMLPQDEASGWLGAQLSFPVFGFCALLMMATAVISGLAPAWQSARTNEGSVLGDRSSASGSGHLSPRVRQALVVGQLALSLVLLSTAGLFGKSLVNLLRHDPGFRAENLLTFAVDAGGRGYSPERGVALYREIARGLAQLPGVQSVAMTGTPPLSNSESATNVTVEGYTAGEGENMDSDINAIGPGYFRTMGTPLMAGREFDERDNGAASRIAIVNQAFVKRFMKGRNAVGMKMGTGGGHALDTTIVGVVADAKNMTLREQVKPCYFIPYDQSLQGDARVRRVSFVMRAHSNPEALGAAARRVVASSDHSLPVFHMDTMQAKIDSSIYTDRLLAALTSAFGLTALLLTAVGLYGVIAYVVGRRTSEIGVRMALGATGRDVVGLVLREVGWLTLFGIVIGVAGAFASTRAVRSQLFGLEGFDPLLLGAAILVLASVAMMAGAVPAIRAARIQPLVALRHE